MPSREGKEQRDGWLIYWFDKQHNRIESTRRRGKKLYVVDITHIIDTQVGTSLCFTQHTRSQNSLLGFHIHTLDILVTYLISLGNPVNYIIDPVLLGFPDNYFCSRRSKNAICG